MNEYLRDISFEPYWWDTSPHIPGDEPACPAAADVVVVGTGFTGASAALTLARAGRTVIGLDAAAIGFGASTRNGGQIGPGNQKFRIGELIDRFGRDKARRLYGEGREMLAFFKDLVARERIDCDLNVCGRFRGAVNRRDYDAIARELEAARRFAGVEGFVVAGAEVSTEITSDEYVGGVVLSEDGSVHPGRFHRALVARARSSGARFFRNTPVTGYRRDKGGFTVATPGGPIRTRDLVIATNGYTGALGPFFRNKIVPAGSGIIATEPLGREQIAGLLPGGRVYGETRRVFSYFRASPDGNRILFGGHCPTAHRDQPSVFDAIYRSMLRVLPDLEGVRITHGWSGWVGVSRDQFPHIGVADGVHYAMGYSGTGVTRSTWFGHKLALKLLGDAAGATSFGDLPFKGHPWPARRPGAANAYVRWLRFRDAVDRLRPAPRRP